MTSLAPANAVVGSPSPTLVVTGTGFVPRSFVEVEFVPLPTSFVSDHELRATLPDSVLARTGGRRITVSTAQPGGGTSGAQSFEVQNPLPKLTTLAPNSALLNAQATRVTLTGSGFVPGSRLTFGGEDVPVTVTDDKTLVATLPATRLASSGTVPMAVLNPAPGGGASPTLAFTVANPNVTISSIDPVTAILGAPSVNVTVTGTGFVAASKVSINGTPVATTFGGATRLTAQVPAGSLATTGNFPIVVTNPAPGGGVSVPATFQVANPTPVATSLSPASVVAGAGPTPIVVNGRNFTRESEIRVDGARQATTYVSGTELHATLVAARLEDARSIAVDVVTPGPGGGESIDLTFTVQNPAPVVTDTSPASLVTGTAEAPINVNGTGFVPASTALVNGAAVPTTYVSATQVHAIVPADALDSPGTISVAVRNPAPGGGTSNPTSMTVSAPQNNSSCDTTGVDVVLTTVGEIKSATLDYKYGPAPRFVFSTTEASYSTCPVGELSTSSQSFAAVVVQNATNDLQWLSAWGACTTNRDDAFMAIYDRDRPVPTTDEARKACNGHVANGSSAIGKYASPESAGSIGCPGLTKTNGGGVVLIPCEKAVVLVQPFMYPTYSRPGSVKVQLEQ